MLRRTFSTFPSPLLPIPADDGSALGYNLNFFSFFQKSRDYLEWFSIALQPGYGPQWPSLSL